MGDAETMTIMTGLTCEHPRMVECCDGCGHFSCPDCGLYWDEEAEGSTMEEQDPNDPWSNTDMSINEERVNQVREALRQWDDGHISIGEFENQIGGDLWLKEFFGALESGQEVMSFGSCCCSAHPPNRTFTVEVTLRPHGYTAKRLSGPVT